MRVLDTNHLSAIDDGNTQGAQLMERLDATGQELAATVVSVEEQMRGWLAQINRSHDDDSQLVFAYQRLQRRVEFFAEWLLLPFDEDAARQFRLFRNQCIRVATLDLRIACICIEHDAILLSRNVKDFDQIPGLKIEYWLD